MKYNLQTPVPEEEIRKLRKGDLVYISGTIITARDEAHLKALELHEANEPVPVDFNGIGVFSARMEIFQDNFIEVFRPAIIIGKGGMGDRTAKACQKYGCVYGAFTGGAALLAARGIKKVKAVYWLEELGMPECLWVYEVENFGPMIVTIDTHGGNLTAEIGKKINAKRDELIAATEG